MNRYPSLPRVILSTLLAASCAGQVKAQDMGAPEVSGPIDIQANEQEFAGDQVIAKGNVRVTYKDSVVHAPKATLSRSATGSPQKAVFTGHPRLVQGQNVVDAETLTFEIATQKFLAEGNAHSEVVSSDSSGKTERIITDADRQEYDRSANRFDALGNVRVVHGNIIVKAQKLQLVYGPDKKPETAIFNGSVVAVQDQNQTQADTLTYSLKTQRMQASGHVKSKVIQKESRAKKPGPSSKSLSLGPAAAVAATTASQDDQPIIVTSDSQDFSRENGRMSAYGNVKVYQGDSTGAGPQAVLIRNAEGKADKVIFMGRSQITQPGKRWIADKITLMVESRKVLAEGNTKAIILQTPAKSTPESKLAGRSGAAISSRKVEPAR